MNTLTTATTTATLAATTTLRPFYAGLTREIVLSINSIYVIHENKLFLPGERKLEEYGSSYIEEKLTEILAEKVPQAFSFSIVKAEHARYLIIYCIAKSAILKELDSDSRSINKLVNKNEHALVVEKLGVQLKSIRKAIADEEETAKKAPKAKAQPKAKPVVKAPEAKKMTVASIMTDANRLYIKVPSNVLSATKAIYLVHEDQLFTEAQRKSNGYNLEAMMKRISAFNVKYFAEALHFNFVKGVYGTYVVFYCKASSAKLKELGSKTKENEPEEYAHIGTKVTDQFYARKATVAKVATKAAPAPAPAPAAAPVKAVPAVIAEEKSATIVKAIVKTALAEEIALLAEYEAAKAVAIKARVALDQAYIDQEASETDEEYIKQLVDASDVADDELADCELKLALYRNEVKFIKR